MAGVEVIALSEHVDYWNRLGWRDPFSSRQFSERQQQYAAHWPGRMYTPQLVIDGRFELVGSDVRQVKQTILQAAEAEKVRPLVEIATAGANEVRLNITVPERAERGAADVYVAVLEDELSTFVVSGENGGRTLPHSAVARTLEKAAVVLPGDGAAREATHRVKLDAEWKRANLRVAVFVQVRKTARIIGAAAVGLGG